MIIAVDFDGTLCEHKFPKIGEPNLKLIKALKRAKVQGHLLILWTCRTGERFRECVAWCKEQGLQFDAINRNISSGQDIIFRKIEADIYIDDRGMTPLDFMNAMRMLN